jgi:predicted PurR-regulated permease PerM
MNNEKILDISWEAILKINIALFCLYILYLIKDILTWIIFALIISVLFNPVIEFLEKRKIPRIISTILVYVTIFGIIALLFYWTIPFFISEIQQFSQLFPQYFEKLSPLLKSLGIQAFENFEVFSKAFQDWLIRASSSIFTAIASIFGGIFSTMTILSIAIFLSIERGGIEKALELLAPKKYEAYFLNLWEKCQIKTAAWFGSRILSCLFVGLFSFLALSLFNINYAFTLSLFAGMTEIVPILGPFFTGILITIITALDSSLKAIFILITFILIQQIEGNILTPLLTKKLIGLPAVLVLISLMIGGRIGGLLGAILAIPLAGIIFEFSKEFLESKKEEKEAVF